MTINLEDYDFAASKKEFNKFRLDEPTLMSNETLAEISLALDIAEMVTKDASDGMIKAGLFGYESFAKPENKMCNAWRKMRDKLISEIFKKRDDVPGFHGLKQT